MQDWYCGLCNFGKGSNMQWEYCPVHKTKNIRKTGRRLMFIPMKHYREDKSTYYRNESIVV